MVYDNVLQALGHTPLVRLSRMSEPDAAEILVKYEGVCVGGSVKTRTAAMMIAEAEKRGGCVLVDLGADTTTVSVYYKNILRHLAVIPIGGNNITKDIASLQIEEAETADDAGHRQYHEINCE